MTVTSMWVDGTIHQVTGTGYVPKGEFQINDMSIDLMDYPARIRPCGSACKQ